MAFDFIWNSNSSPISILSLNHKIFYLFEYKTKIQWYFRTFSNRRKAWPHHGSLKSESPDHKSAKRYFFGSWLPPQPFCLIWS